MRMLTVLIFYSERILCGVSKSDIIELKTKRIACGTIVLGSEEEGTVEKRIDV